MGVLAAIVIGLVFLVKNFSEKTSQDMSETKSFYEVAAEDEQRLRAEPEFDDRDEIEVAATEVPESEREVADSAGQFRELTEIEEIEAERLFEVAIKHRSIGRLPGTGYGVMVDTCRQIIDKFPDSVYAYKARRMLGEVPRRFWSRYKITKEEINPQ